MKNCLRRVLTTHALLSTIALGAACEEEPMAMYAPRGVEDDGGQDESDAGLTDDGSGTYILPNPRILEWQALPLDPPRIAMGDDHSCAIDLDKHVRCWGWNGEGQSAVPAELENVETIAAGQVMTCAITEDARLVCWGGTSFEPALAGDVPQGEFREVGVGSLHACAIKMDDTIVCWGDAGYGQTSAPQGTFHKLTVSEAHACALDLETNRPVCWGRGSEPGGEAFPPEDVVLESISAGAIHTCGLDEDRKPVCWGPGVAADACDNINAAATPCGQGDPPDEKMLLISSGFSHTCAILPGAEARCWGSDVYSQSRVPGGRFTQIASGVDHSCGITLTGALRCWGQDNQLKTTPPEDFFPEE